MSRLRHLLTTTMIMGLSVTTRALAEEAKPSADKPAEVVVTGSRLRKTTFTSPSAVQVITTAQAELVGQNDTSGILQTSTIGATASQIDNNYTGYVTTGGPGANTLSLRGLGTARTLILVNGHRVGPAGVRGTVGPVDLNTIPNALVSRYEILKDGASSLYGSDAVAGVVNVITKKDYSGGSAKVVYSATEHGGGDRFNLSLSQGFKTGRWHGTVAADYYDQSALNLGDRDWSSCQNPILYYADGTRADYLSATTGTYNCNTLSNGYVYSGSYYVPDSTATLGGGATGLDRVGWHRVNYTYPTTTADYINKSRVSKAELPVYADKFSNKNIVSPVTRSNFALSGGYDLNDDVEIYTDILFNKRDSSTNSWRQLFPTVNITNPNNIFKTGNTNGLTTASAYSVIAVPSITSQEVDYKRALFGIKGKLPDYGSFKNWTWDVAAQISYSDGTYGGTFVYNDRVNATTAAGTVCNTSLLTTATACPTGGVQWFRPSTVSTGVFTDEETAFLFGYEEGHTLYQQQYIEANFAGDLFTLPAGVVSGAFGLQYRNEFLHDTPGTQAKANNYWGSTTAGDTKGKDTIKEVYGEISVPVVKDVFLIKHLDLDLSTRYSDYSSYGSSSTYKAGVNWALTDHVRIRGSQGTSFRAPGLYERFLGGQTSYSAQSVVDPCYKINLGTLTSPSATMIANCAAAGITSTYTGGSSATVIAGGNGKTLKAETSENKTIGVVWTPKFAPLQVSLDYYAMKVNNEITQFGAYNIAYECYNSVNLTSPYCSLMTRVNAASGSYVAGNISLINNNYVNVAEEYQRGMDLSIAYRQTIKGVKFAFTSDNTFVTKWSWQLLNASTPTDELGLVGYPAYNGKLNFNFAKGDYTLNWGVDMIGKTSNYDYYGTDATLNYGYTGVTVYNKMGTEFYANHSLTLSKKMKNYTLTATVRNLLDEDPPAISSAYSSRVGNAPLTSQYDQYGRTFVLNITHTW